MRRDMARKIKEKGKGGGWSGDANRRRRAKFRDMSIEDMDTLPEKEGMRRPHVLHWGGKHAKENLNPLYRYLNSQAGCKWDDVWSEICREIKDTNIRECVFYLVEDKVKIIDGKPYRADIRYNYGGRGEIPIEDWRWGGRSYRQMYVDPRDGVLKFAPKCKKRARQKKTPNRLMSTDRLTQYHRINDVWYEITFRDLQDKDFKTTNYLGYSMPEYRWYVIAHDILNPNREMYPYTYYRPYPTKGEWIRYYGDLIVPIRKRQLNSKEIKRFKLK